MDKAFLETSKDDIEYPITHTDSAPSLGLDNTNRHCDDATKEAQELFGRTIGKCYGSFSCSHSRIRGRLYVSSRALLFYSSLLGFETRISLDFHDVLDIELFRTTSISVRTFEGETYVFKSFEDRNAALHLLETYLHTSLDTNSIASSITNAFSPGKPRHRSASSFSSTNLDEPFQYNQVLKSNPVAVNRRRCVSDSIVNGQDNSLMEQTPAPLPQSSSTKLPELTNISSEKLLGEKREIATTWDDVENGKLLQEIAVKSLDLPCSLESFFQTFLADDADHSLTRYQSERIQDHDVKASPWEVDQGKNEIIATMSRTITFTHPIKSVAMGLGPSEARTKRHQQLWRFEKGILLKNTTHIEGIPNADTFCISDRWVITEIHSSCVQLSSSFELQFTKRSLFRSIIEKSVKRETFEWWSGYCKMIQDALLPKQEAPPKASLSSDILLLEGQILERLDRHYKWTIRLLTSVIVLLFGLLLLLVSLFSFFTSEIRLLRESLQPVQLISPAFVVDEL